MNPNYLDFEQPIAELESKIEELSSMGDSAALNINDEVKQLKDKSLSLTESIFSDLSSWQIAQLARHPKRPYTLDYVARIFTEFDELHGDMTYQKRSGTPSSLAMSNNLLHQGYLPVGLCEFLPR